MRTDLRLLDIKEQWLRQLILEKSKSSHFVEAYKLTPNQILEYIETMVERGLTWFFGSEAERFVYRVVQPNPYVIEPHYLGCMKKLRELQPVALKWLWENTTVKKINIYTTRKASVRIQQRFGYKLEGTITDTFLEDGKLLDLYVLGLSREAYYEQQIHLPAPTGCG